MPVGRRNISLISRICPGTTWRGPTFTLKVWVVDWSIDFVRFSSRCALVVDWLIEWPWLIAANNVTLGVWLLHPENHTTNPRPDMPVILYVHGNAGSRATLCRTRLYSNLQRLGFTVVAFDYRLACLTDWLIDWFLCFAVFVRFLNRSIDWSIRGNCVCQFISSLSKRKNWQLIKPVFISFSFMSCRGYGDSSGTPWGEEDLVQDGFAVYEWTRRQFPDKELFVWGHSLGTGVSTHLVQHIEAAGLKVDGLILDSPFSDLDDAMRSHPLLSPLHFVPGFTETVATAMKIMQVRFRWKPGPDDSFSFARVPWNLYRPINQPTNQQLPTACENGLHFGFLTLAG